MGRSVFDFEWSNSTVAHRLRHMMSKRSLLFHVMLRQGTSWYALDNIECLLPPPCIEESEL